MKIIGDAITIELKLSETKELVEALLTHTAIDDLPQSTQDIFYSLKAFLEGK